MNLDKIIERGKRKIHRRVERVIRKHDTELLEIDRKAKSERESALMSIARNGNCHDADHSRRMVALRGGNQRYLYSLAMAYSRSLGIGTSSGLGGANQASAGSALWGGTP